MTKQEIIDYKVLKNSQKAKDKFNSTLKSNYFKIIGSFKNEYGELYVIFDNNNRVTHPLISELLSVTGDKLRWTLDYQIDKDGNIFKQFMINQLEREGLVKIVEKYREENND